MLHYAEHETDVERLDNCHDIVEKDQWPTLVRYWSFDSVKV